jgi:ribosomal protein S18 acetylase RimI-like enzyme
LGENVQLEFIEKLNESQFRDLCELFKNEWWSYYRKPEEIKTLIENSDLLIGIIDKGTSRLVAFARVLTDYIFRSMIYDVIVDKEYRNKGIGKMLLQNIIEHPALQKVEFVELQTQPELISYYRQFGFKEEIVGKMKTMRIIKKIENMKK